MDKKEKHFQVDVCHARIPFEGIYEVLTSYGRLYIVAHSKEELVSKVLDYLDRKERRCSIKVDSFISMFSKNISTDEVFVISGNRDELRKKYCNIQ